MKNVLITGANGFIARSISRLLSESGYFIVGVSRTHKPIPNYNEVFQGVLGEQLKDVYARHKIDVVVHCAYDKHNIDNIMNAEGTRIWAEQAERNNVGLQIFMSSISADKDAAAPYGQKKYETEKWFLAHDHIVLRLGLVIGNGGIFSSIVSSVKEHVIVPLIDGGKTLTYLTDVDVMCEIVRDAVMNNNKIARGKIWYLQQESPVYFVDILREIQSQNNLFRIFIPVPYFLVFTTLNLIEKLKILKLGITTNNLKGLRQTGSRKIESDLKTLGYPEIPLELLIKKTII
ncbi:MAG: NAD-dependent epimerase/dehydratase family protein [Nitrospirae bacterium]|nr:NAD-dependent epimerase/dehydratase family protein [Nitrospirota bacterium]